MINNLHNDIWHNHLAKKSDWKNENQIIEINKTCFANTEMCGIFF